MSSGFVTTSALPFLDLSYAISTIPLCDGAYYNFRISLVEALRARWLQLFLNKSAAVTNSLLNNDVDIRFKIIFGKLMGDKEGYISSYNEKTTIYSD